LEPNDASYRAVRLRDYLRECLVAIRDRYLSEGGQLDEKDKFLRLLPGGKRLMDTIRMIAYRKAYHHEGGSTLNTSPGNIPKRIRRAANNPPHRMLKMGWAIKAGV